MKFSYVIKKSFIVEKGFLNWWIIVLWENNKEKNICQKVWAFRDQNEAKILFQRLRFYNTFSEQPKITDLKHIDLLQELPFYDELNIYKISKAFPWYARNYKVEIIDLKDTLVQLEASKLSIKYLFKDLLDEIKGFKYQITVEIFLGKDKQNGDIEFASVYFNPTTKTVINFQYYLDKSIQ